MFLSILRDAGEVSDFDGYGVFRLSDTIGMFTFEREQSKKRDWLIPRIQDEGGKLHEIHTKYTFFSQHSLHLTILP